MGYRTARRNKKLNRVKKLETELKLLRNRNKVLESVVNTEYYRKFLNMEDKVFKANDLCLNITKKIDDIEFQEQQNASNIVFLHKLSGERYRSVKNRLKRKTELLKRQQTIAIAVIVLCIAGIFIF